MIYFCACTKSSSSPPVNPKHPDKLKSCKSCGGKLPVERGAQQGIMLSNIGLDQSNVISRHLSWKTAPNGRRRSLRRARTSFTLAKRMDSYTKNLKASKDLTDKDSKNRYMLASESEKVGVNILGRRFSDTVGSVPIKKRRLLLASYQDALLTAKQHSHDVNSGCESELVEDSNFGFEKSDLEVVTEKICDAADFSGISILAAAACDRNIGGEFMNVEFSTLKQQFSEVQKVPNENAKLSTAHEKEDPQPQTSEDLFGRTDLPFEESCSSVLHSTKSNEARSDGSCNLETSVNSFQDVLNKTTSSSGNVKFQWDLNIAVEEWDGHEVVLSSDGEAANNAFMNVEYSTLKQQISEVHEVPNENAKLSTAHEIEDPQPPTSEDLFGSTDLPSALYIKKSNKAKFDGSCNLEKTSVNSFQNGLNKTTSSSGNVKFHWDLNIAVEERDSHEVVLSSDREVANNASEDGDYSAKLGNAESYMDQVGFGGCTTDSQSVNIRDRSVAGERKVMCVSHVKTEVIHGISSNNLTADSKESKPFALTRCLQAEENVPLCANSGAVKSEERSLVCHLAEKCFDGNASEDMVNVHVIFGRNTHMNALDETDTDNTDKATSKHDSGQGKTTAAEVKMDTTKLKLPCDEFDTAKNDFPSNVGPVIFICKPTGNAPSNLDASPALSSQEVCIHNTGQVALENDLECHYYSDASQNNNDLANRIEKVEFLGDDDSQYEDGEFRQPVANFWIYDGTEERENEQVDSGSDTCEAAPDFSSGNRRASDMGFSDASYDNKCKEVGNRVVGLTLRRDSSSRIERARSSDMSQRKSKSHVRLARYNERNGFNPRIEGYREDPPSIDTSGPQHFQGRGKDKGDQWVDSSNHHGNSRHDSFHYYGHHGSRNGFFIATDGTSGNSVAKGCSQNTHHPPMARRSQIKRVGLFGMSSRPGPSREMSPDRPTFVGRNKPCRMDGVIHNEKYRGPLLNDITDSSSSMHHTTHRRDCNFSPPHRLPLHVAWSHSRSPSRPRTRSPHSWTSPSSRWDNVMNDGPGSRRCNAFPKFKCEGRIDSSRNHTSLPRASRWTDGRKEVPEHFGDYENRRYPGRRPPTKVFARGHRFDLMDSRRRHKPDEYGYPMNSGRFHEFVGFDGGSIHDGKCDNSRKHDDRYEMPHSAKLSVNDDNNGFLAQNVGPKSSELHRRENLRDFDRCRKRRRGDSPRRSKEEKSPF